MKPDAKTKILICGVLPPPYFGHSMLYETLMSSPFASAFDIRFLNMHFWSYATNKKVTFEKLFKLFLYYVQFCWRLLTFRPVFVLYNTSFYKMPFLKDFLFCATGILAGGKLVIHDHGQYVRELHDALTPRQLGMLQWLLKRATASIVMGERVRPFYEGLMPQEKLFVVPGSVYDSRSIKVEADRPAAELNVLYFSHMSYPKGIDVAFAAAAQVLRAERKVHFTFAGPIASDDIARDLEQLQANYPGRVRYMGYVEDAAERTALFRGADVFFFPTVRDVFGLVLLHAMAEGIPIVASEEGTIPEIVLDGENGRLFPKGNAAAGAGTILALLRDEAGRARMRPANLRRYEESYSVEAYGRKMIEVLQWLGA